MFLSSSPTLLLDHLSRMMDTDLWARTTSVLSLSCVAIFIPLEATYLVPRARSFRDGCLQGLRESSGDRGR